MAKKPMIIVVGSFIVDLAASTPRFPTDGETVLGEKLVMGPGGKGSNQATAAKRAGGDVYMITKIGKDILSNIPLEHYKNEGMSTEFVFTSETAATGSAVIEVHKTRGENRIIVLKGANDELTVEEVRSAEEKFSECDVVLLQLEANLDAEMEAIRLAKKYNKLVVMNPAPMQEVPEGMFDGIDYFTPNETETSFFSGMPVTTVEEGYAAGKKLMETMGVKNVVITFGKQGAILVNKDTCQLVPTTDLKPVDTTGAGDAFNGGLCVGLAEGRDIVDSIKFANCLASIEVTRFGTSPACPYRHEIDELYNDFYKD